jgi:hypothetical protein
MRRSKTRIRCLRGSGLPSRRVRKSADGLPCAWVSGRRADLVPAGGASVAETAARLRADLAGYQRYNPHCWGRIQRAVDEPSSLMVLSRQPMIEAGHGACATAAGPYVVDGLHRMVAWELAGRLDHAVSIRACICG